MPLLAAQPIRHPLADGNPPRWACCWGQDRFGIFADFSLPSESGRVAQRMRWLPPGTFTMGSPADEPGRFDREGPQHEVTLSEGFWIFDTSCTQALWNAAMEENPSRFVDDQRPVERVTWHDCQQFVKRINERKEGLELTLPTEAQWEYACRAGTTTATYAGGIEILGDNNAPVLDSIAWYGGNSGVEFELENGVDSSGWAQKQHEHERAGTRKVAKKKPNAWGLYDMLGNVFEWCDDVLRDYTESPVADPTGPADEGAVRVIRGGCWFHYARFARSAFRSAYVPGLRSYYLGFRCARVRLAGE